MERAYLDSRSFLAWKETIFYPKPNDGVWVVRYCLERAGAQPPNEDERFWMITADWDPDSRAWCIYWPHYGNIHGFCRNVDMLWDLSSNPLVAEVSTQNGPVLFYVSRPSQESIQGFVAGAGELASQMRIRIDGGNEQEFDFFTTPPLHPQGDLIYELSPQTPSSTPRIGVILHELDPESVARIASYYEQSGKRELPQEVIRQWLNDVAEHQDFPD